MPVFNEERTLSAAIEQVLEVDYPCEMELVIVDDGSTDRTSDILRDATDRRIRSFRQDPNQGKGAAIRRAAEEAAGDYLIICDADLEYTPGEIPSLLSAVGQNDVAVVYGTRSFGSHNAYSFWYVMGNKGVALFANLIFNVYISDVETCFKLMPTSLYRELDVQSAGFGMEAEITGSCYAEESGPLKCRSATRHVLAPGQETHVERRSRSALDPRSSTNRTRPFRPLGELRLDRSSGISRRRQLEAMTANSTIAPAPCPPVRHLR